MKDKIIQKISKENFLKFFVSKDKIKNSVSLQLTNISGEIPKLKDNIV